MSHKHIAKTHEKMELGDFPVPQYHTSPFMVGLSHIHILTFFPQIHKIICTTPNVHYVLPDID